MASTQLIFSVPGLHDSVVNRLVHTIAGGRRPELMTMPIFEYHCPDCGGDCEIFLRGGEEPACPTCRSQRLEKLMSAPAGHMGSSRSLPITGSSCPPPQSGPCGPGCCRLPNL